MKRVLIISLLSSSLLYGDNANIIMDPVFIKYDRFFLNVEKKYQVPATLTKAIALTESSFKEKANRKNTNKTSDTGLMQINTIWEKTFNLTKGNLLDPETNIDTAGRILHGLIIRHGYSWETIGRYHSNTPKYKKAWLKKVKKNIALIIKHDKRLKYKVLVK